MATVISKPIYKSTTFWFNLAVLAASVTGAATAGLAQVGVTSGKVVGVLGGIAAICNIALRFRTVQPATTTGGDPVQVPSP